MIVTVHQPHYLPWTGYLDKIDTADVFVLLDTVQFEKNGWQNRNRIKTPDGWTWLTVPVRHKLGESILEVEVENRTPWERKHRNALATSYGRAPWYRTYAPLFDGWYGRGWERFCPLAEETLGGLLRAFGIGTEVVRSSDLGPLPDDPNGRLAEIVRRLGGDVYLAGMGASGYFRPEPFEQAGIRVVFQEYEPKEYPQQFGPFVAGLSAVDLLVNCGERSLAVIHSGRRTVV